MKPWLWLPTKFAHDVSPLGLQILSAFRRARAYEWQPFVFRGLPFKNRLGIAGGVDKDGEFVENWWTFGPGFIEVGTVTPKAQAANPGKIIARDIENGALWNRMGFPGGGVLEMRENLKDLPETRVTPVFVNIGKNRDTPNERAADDYITCIETIGDLADAFVVNISSPNTTGLRELFQPHVFAPFIASILEARDKFSDKRVPVLLKLSPDLSAEDLGNVVLTANQLGIDGFIATNTTVTREPGSPFPTEGGVSGRPVAKRSKNCLQDLLRLLGSSKKDRLVISTGGVMTPDDVRERLAMGADLVQVYTALVYEGPWFFGQVARMMQPALPAPLQ